ncbi:unnamed protein product [Effrenium voratum]|uniref:Translation elongation factor P/YeiP central domain-containing protein n=1 Tax=Effrenium voratum TaxID=2562239 RepID=A0AA36IYV9_9DINO|nr:unnamed protein product [Effrenium voratum]
MLRGLRKLQGQILCRMASSDRIPSADLQRGHVFLHKGVYCEVRSARAAGHGRSATGGFEIRFRELQTRKAREMKLKENDRVDVINCDRVSMPVLYKDEKWLVLADADYNEVAVSRAQLGDAAEMLQSGEVVSVMYHDDNIVKVVPPPHIADAVRDAYRKQRRAQLAARRKSEEAADDEP